MKRRFLTTFVLVALLLIAVFGATGAYGATTEDHIRIDGIDVSDFNGDVDWQKVKEEGNEFALIRIGGRYFSVNADFDDTYEDSKIKANFEGALANDIMVGGYFFSQAITVEEAEYEAIMTHEYLTACGISPSDLALPIFIDREYVSGASGPGRLMAANLSIEDELAIELAFCNKMRELGYEAGLYSYASFLIDNTDSSVLSNQGYPIWVAHYEPTCGYDKHYDFWQYSEDGNISGIVEATDLNYWYINKSLDANLNSHFTLDRCSIKLTSIPVYSGEAIIPTFEVVDGMDGEKTLLENVDYKVITYLDNVELGTGYAIIRGLGPYTGHRAVPFEIVSKLEAPQNVKVTTVASSGKPKVTWNAVEGASGYEVWRKVGSNDTYKKFYTTTNLYMTNTSANAGTTYYYKVKAIHPTNNNANSDLSNYSYITCDLAAPTMSLSTVTDTGKPKVSWNEVEGASKYEVWRKIGSNGEYKKFYTTTNLSMINTSAEAGERYYYKVKAIYAGNSYANSADSNSDYRTCDLARPVMKPTTLSTSGKPTISWNKVDGASEYIIYRKVGETGEYSKYYTTTNTSFTNVSATKGVRYYYKVVAVYPGNSAANSAYGNVAYMMSK